MAKKYDWRITVFKFAWSFAEIFVAGVIALATENPSYMFLVPIAEAVRNWIKHKD